MPREGVGILGAVSRARRIVRPAKRPRQSPPHLFHQAALSGARGTGAPQRREPPREPDRSWAIGSIAHRLVHGLGGPDGRGAVSGHLIAELTGREVSQIPRCHGRPHELRAPARAAHVLVTPVGQPPPPDPPDPPTVAPTAHPDHNVHTTAILASTVPPAPSTVKNRRRPPLARRCRRPHHRPRDHPRDHHRDHRLALLRRLRLLDVLDHRRRRALRRRLRLLDVLDRRRRRAHLRRLRLLDVRPPTLPAHTQPVADGHSHQRESSSGKGFTVFGGSGPDASQLASASALHRTTCSLYLHPPSPCA